MATRVTYKSSASSRRFEPDLIPDTSDRILKQGQEYIEKLKASRDFEAAQDAEFLREYERRLNEARRSKNQVNQETLRQSQALAQYKVQNMEAQARRAESLGSSVSGDDNKTLAWVNFALKLSETAANVAVDLKKQQDEQAVVQAGLINSLFPVGAESIGANHQLGTAKIDWARKDSVAAWLENNGSPEAAERVRGANATTFMELKKLRAVDLGRNAADEFQMSLDDPNNQGVVNINGQQVLLNQIPRDTQSIEQAFNQWLPQYYAANGINDLANPLVAKGLGEARKSYEQLAGSYRNRELQAAKSNRIDQAETIFGIKVKNSDEAQIAILELYQAYYNNNGGDHANARKQLFERFTSSTNIPEDAFEALKQTVFVGQSKQVQDIYADEIEELRLARLRNDEVVTNELDRVQQLEAKKLIQQISSRQQQDYAEDGQINIDPTIHREQILKYKNKGPNYAGVVSALEAMTPHLESSQMDAKLQTEWQILHDRKALSQTDILTSAASSDLKREWLKKVNTDAVGSIRKEDLTYFESLARTQLMRRSKETPGATGHSNSPETIRALKYAKDQYRLDYAMALRDGKSVTEAAKYAEERFNDRFQNSNLYDVTEFTDFDPESNKPITTGRFKNFGSVASPAIDEPYVELRKKIEEFGAAVVDQPNVIDRASLERTSNYMQRNKTVIVPPSIVTLAESTGGSLSVMDVLNRQLKANGLPQINPDIYATAKQTQMSINPVWQPFLNYKPQVQTTDAAMIGSGQEPIYAQSTPAQERIKSIFGKRESPQAGYDAINRGRGGDTPGGARKRYGRALTEMTLGEVKQLQAQELNAVGRYQFIESTLREAASDAGITDDMLFNEAVQDRIFFVHLDKYGAYGPWERWWIEQGGPHLALTSEEKQVISAFRNSYNPTDPWREAKNLNPAVIPAIPQEEEQPQAPELSGYFTYNKDGEKIPEPAN